MKKIIISLVLLGAVSLGAMAVMQNRPDEPPVRRTEARHYSNCGRGHCDVSRHADAPRRHYAPRRDRRSYDDVYLRR